MTNRRRMTYRVLTVLVALYGAMSVCICTDHTSSQIAMATCYHCPSSTIAIDAAAPQIASHHQCCGMERAPIAVEKAVPVLQPISDQYIVLPTATLLTESSVALVAVSSLAHAPPGDIPIYFTTQRFLI